MMRISKSEQHLDPVMIRAFSSLTQADADVVRNAVATASADWSVECHDHYDGYLSLVVTPTTTREDDLTFVVSGTMNQIELAEARGDLLATLGRFSTIQAASARLAELLVAVDQNPGT